MQNQLFQVDHQEKDNKGRTEIDIPCHLPSSASTDYRIRANFLFFFALVEHHRLLRSLSSREKRRVDSTSFTLPKIFPEINVRSEEILSVCVPGEHSACIEAFGSPALRFCHLYLCTSPSQVHASPSTLRQYPPSFYTRCCVVRRATRPSFSLCLSLSLFR